MNFVSGAHSPGILALHLLERKHKPLNKFLLNTYLCLGYVNLNCMHAV